MSRASVASLQEEGMAKTAAIAAERLLRGVIMSAVVHNSGFAPMTERPDDRLRLSADAGAERTVETTFDLVLRAQSGDGDAVEALCVRYLPRLKRWAHGRLPVSSRRVLDTEDLVQDVLLQTVRHVDTFQPRHEGAFGGYMRRAIMNRLRDEGRKDRRRPQVASIEDEHADEGPSPLECAIGKDALDRYEAALERLKPQERELIIARVELGFSAAEIAAEFGKPTAAAAQMAVSRALVKMAEEMSRG
jgi:RNA polymerase sigma-70 factor, ECF subfamily